MSYFKLNIPANIAPLRFVVGRDILSLRPQKRAVTEGQENKRIILLTLLGGPLVFKHVKNDDLRVNCKTKNAYAYYHGVELFLISGYLELKRGKNLIFSPWFTMYIFLFAPISEVLISLEEVAERHTDWNWLKNLKNN